MKMPCNVTMDGVDGTYLVCPKINVWKNYSDRTQGLVTTVKHGDTVRLIKRQGNRCLIEVEDVRGYVTFYFIKELKAKWNAERIKAEKEEPEAKLAESIMEYLSPMGKEIMRTVDIRKRLER